jgi:predicted CXXCH cytochrome family protein
MKKSMFTVLLIAWSITAMADDSDFSAHLYAKFKTRGCTRCHDFHDKTRGGLVYNTHKGRGPEMCTYCHTREVTGYEHPDEWFAQPGLYLSGMDAKQTCETMMAALHAGFKSRELLARQIEKHLFEDPRVLWGIEGATSRSGMLPGGKKEEDLVKGGMALWKEQVTAWIQGGMKCK